MTDIIPFDFNGAGVRVIEHENEAWFVAKDVAVALGYKKPHKTVADHCKAAKSLIELGAPNQGPLDNQTRVVPERDIYRLVMRSKMPAAERFEEWVVGEVLPTIRKMGGYQMQPPMPEDYPTALRRLADETEAKEAAEKQIERDKPYAELGRTVAGEETIMTLRDWCALMKDEYAVSLKEKALHNWLINNDYLYRDQLTGRLKHYAKWDVYFKEAAEVINNGHRQMTKIKGNGIKDLTPLIITAFDPD